MKGGQPPPIGQRDKATQAALNGHASRITNWTAGANNIGALIFLQVCAHSSAAIFLAQCLSNTQCFVVSWTYGSR